MTSDPDPLDHDSEAPSASAGNAGSVSSVTEATAPEIGKRQVFRDLRRQLSDQDLKSPGVQKLLLDELDRAESDCDTLRNYVDRFHASDKECGVLKERVRFQTAFEILFSCGIGIGCAIIGLAPFFWDATGHGIVTLAVGSLLVIGSVIARAVKR